LSRTLFRRLRDRIMNIDPSSKYHSSNHCRSVLSAKDGNSDPSHGSESITDVDVTLKKTFKDALLKGL